MDYTSNDNMNYKGNDDKMNYTSNGNTSNLSKNSLKRNESVLLNMNQTYTDSQNNNSFNVKDRILDRFIKNKPKSLDKSINNKMNEFMYSKLKYLSISNLTQINNMNDSEFKNWYNNQSNSYDNNF